MKKTLAIIAILLCIFGTSIAWATSGVEVSDDTNNISTEESAVSKIVETKNNEKKTLEEYKDLIPTGKDKIGAKLIASFIIVVVVSLILRYINGYTEFKECFTNSIILWTIVNIYDVIILDICWFCQSERFIFKGTEDIKSEYKNYWFHIKEGLIGEIIGLVISLVISLVVGFIL